MKSIIWLVICLRKKDGVHTSDVIESWRSLPSANRAVDRLADEDVARRHMSNVHVYRRPLIRKTTRRIAEVRRTLPDGKHEVIRVFMTRSLDLFGDAVTMLGEVADV